MALGVLVRPWLVGLAAVGAGSLLAKTGLEWWVLDPALQERYVAGLDGPLLGRTLPGRPRRTYAIRDLPLLAKWDILNGRLEDAWTRAVDRRGAVSPEATQLLCLKSVTGSLSVPFPEIAQNLDALLRKPHVGMYPNPMVVLWEGRFNVLFCAS
jgi:hypothetical protein